MRVGCPKEIKNHEYRVGLTPGSVREYVTHGHDVLIETGAGAGIGADDNAYRSAGATIAKTAAEVFAKSDMVVKVKEPQPSEWVQLREGQILYTYLHLAPDRADQGAGRVGVTAMPTRRSQTIAAACRCSPPMSSRRPARGQAGATALRRPMADAASCSAASRASFRPGRGDRRRRRRSEQQRWRWASAPTSPSSTGRSAAAPARRHLQRRIHTRYSTVEAIEDSASPPRRCRRRAHSRRRGSNSSRAKCCRA